MRAVRSSSGEGYGRDLRVRHYPFRGRLRLREGSLPRLALSIGRRNGGATVRSRVKRVLREVFRHVARELPPGAWVEITAEGDLTRVPRRTIRAAGEALLRGLVQGWQSSRLSQDTSVGSPFH